MKTRTPSKKQAGSSALQTKAKNQANNTSILQAYKEGTTQLAAEDEEPAQRKENKTGLPDNLKSGVENLSGHSMDDVKVHYNSSQPAALQAHAYAQGTDIHVAPGQEKHLPHEAWHVVQQKQGRVQPTKQLKGTTPVNDDAGLEKEADVMGAQAMQLKADGPDIGSLENQAAKNQVHQLQTSVEWNSQDFKYMNREGNEATKEVGGTMEATLDPKDPVEGADAKSTFQKDMYDDLKSYWEPGAKHWVRGHLLNANLGGPNVAPNLFPITGYANGDHLNYVENHVKKWVMDGKKVKYTVEASQTGGNVDIAGKSVPNAAGSLDCTAEEVDGEKKISRTIYSDPVKRSAKNADTVSGHTSRWARKTTGDNEVFDEVFESWNEDQLKYTICLLENDFNYRITTRTVPITLDDLGQILDDLDILKASIETVDEEEDGDLESEDTENDKVGSRVTNAKLKKWLGKSLSDDNAEQWLKDHRVGVSGKKYSVTGSEMDKSEDQQSK